MDRNHNTNRNGTNWTENEKISVSKKGKIIPDFAPEVWRWDRCGDVMKWNEHGNRNLKNGWEIDHINSVSNLGGDEISNLQPLHWKNNLDKGDKLNWNCA